MVLSRTITAPTFFRSQVDRVATYCAILMKYSSHGARFGFAGSTGVFFFLFINVLPFTKCRLL